jgi:hypothetical protein
MAREFLDERFTDRFRFYQTLVISVHSPVHSRPSVMGLVLDEYFQAS